jgi:predicted PurR-regulated permease PerM
MRMIVDSYARRHGSSGRLQRNARAALVVGLLALGGWIIHGFLPALIWAAILVIAVWPSYSRACRTWPGGRRVVLPAAFTTLTGLIFIVPLILIGLQVGREAHDFFQFVHGLEQSGIPVPSWVASLPFGGPQIADWWSRNLSAPFHSNDIFHHISRASLVSATREFGAKFAHRIVIFAFTLLTLFFLFKDGESLSAEMLQASQQIFGSKGEHIARQMVASVHGTVDGLVFVGIGEGVVLGIAYYFTGVTHPVLLGAVTAVAAMIPFGAVIAFGGASLFLIAQGSLGPAIFVFALGLVVLGVADHLVRPAVIGGATKLPFVWVLLGILGGVETFGLLGLFLGPAVMSALILLWRELVAKQVAETHTHIAA